MRLKVTAKILVSIVGGIMPILNTEATKLAGRNTSEMYVNSWTFFPCAIVVRASRTEDALKTF